MAQKRSGSASTQEERPKPPPSLFTFPGDFTGPNNVPSTPKNACLPRSDVTLFRIELFADLMSSVEIRSYRMKVGPKASSRPAGEREGSFRHGARGYAEGKRPRGTEADHGGSATARGHCGPQVLREAGRATPEGAPPCHPWISRFRSAGWERMRFWAGSC